MGNRLAGARKAKDLVLNELEEALSLKGGCREPSCGAILHLENSFNEILIDVDVMLRCGLFRFNTLKINQQHPS